VPRRKTTSSVACTRPTKKVVAWRKPVVPQRKEISKQQLYAMLAEAVRNTG